MITKFILLIIAAYLLGAIPFALIIAKAYGIDLRKVGSGNIGATNLSRALGRKWGYTCFALDVAKGFIPMLTAARLMSSQPGILELFMVIAVGGAAVIGHIFPIYIGFKGGKGVATAFGVAIGFWPYYTIAVAAAFVIWCIVVLVWRYISLGSIVAAIIFPVTFGLMIRISPSWQLAHLWPLFIAAAAIPFMVIIRHRDNIKRLIAGTESKVFSERNES